METLSSIFNFFKKEVTSFLNFFFAMKLKTTTQLFPNLSKVDFRIQNILFGKSKIGKLKVFFCSLIILLSYNLSAQTASTYTFSASASTWTALASASTFTFQTSATADEDYSNAVTMPFTFTFCGTGYTSCFVSTNGWLKFGSHASPQLAAFTNNTANLINIKPAVFPLWDDLQNFAGTTYKVDGTSPNRIFKAQWNQEWNYSANGSVMLMQVWLYETTNVIEFYYNRGSTSLSSASASIGIVDGASNYLSTNGGGTSPTASSSTFTSNINAKPANGQKYTFTPCSASTTFYSKSTGNLDLISSWGTNADGSGTAPCNFTNASTTYYIANRTTATIGANWTVSGAGSKVVLGQASAAAVTFTVPNNFSFTGAIDVPAASSGSNTFVLNNTTVPTLGTLHSGSTVKYNATGSQTIQATTYGNLETGVESGTSNSTKTVAASGTLSIAGNLTINDYSTFNLNDRDMTLTGDFVRTSASSPTTSLFSHGTGTTNTVTFNGSSQEVNVTAANGTTPTNGDITFNHVTIDGASVKLFYFKTNDRKLNINNFTVNSNKVVTLYSNPQP